MQFFSIDWGTSSFRIRLVKFNHDKLEISFELVNEYGCNYIREQYKNAATEGPISDYYFNFLKPYLTPFADSNRSFKLPVVISGMASSTIGIKELPYAQLPFNLDGDDANYAYFSPSENFEHPVILLSGVHDTCDVMRGEETQLIGLNNHLKHAAETIYILPGTHSKHVYVKNNSITQFNTHITGELFKRISTQSLLKDSVEWSDEVDKEAFITGVRLSEKNITHQLFGIRANSLLNKSRKTSNYSLLSGLLIGYELRELLTTQAKIVLCAHGNLEESYKLAISELNLNDRCECISHDVVDDAIIYGQKCTLLKLANKIDIQF